MKFSICVAAMLGLGLLAANAASAAGRPDVEAYCQKRYLNEAAAYDMRKGRGGGLGLFNMQGGGAAQSKAGQPSRLARPHPAPPAQAQALQSARAEADIAHREPPPGPNRDRYPETDPNPIKLVAETPVSTFSADVDSAAYAVVRRHLEKMGRLPPTDAVRPEELINAFDYAYAAPDAIADGFRPDVAVYPAPWNADRMLMRIGVKGYDIPEAERPAANLVFLLDVSGSMRALDKLPLAKTAICMLVHQLKADDHIAMVVYAGAAGVVLEPTSAKEKSKILEAMDKLHAGGSTAGGQGVELAYALAEAHFQKDAANRIVLATDGDFNVGIADPRKLRDYVAKKRATGVYLTTLGFGMGNYNDLLMQALAQAGNGVAAYIDSVDEAHRVLVRGLTASIVTIAKDVKFQVEFNPARVAEYRLIGYETRLLDRADFNNDKVDAGDVGSGHTVTAIYELALVGSKGRAIEALRYQASAAPTPGVASELAMVRLRFKTPDADESRLIERPVVEGDVRENIENAGDDARFATAVAWFAEALRGSAHVDADWGAIHDLATGAIGEDPYNDRRAFAGLVLKAEKVAKVN